MNKYIDAENWTKAKEENMKRLFVLLLAIVSSCVQPSEENETQDGKDTIVATIYTIKGTQRSVHVEKFIIEGHEYLVFSNKLANPPFVVHSEGCPCKNIEENK